MSPLTVKTWDQILGIICQGFWDGHFWTKTLLRVYPTMRLYNSIVTHFIPTAFVMLVYNV